MKEKALIAMSGGVDSAVAALLLKNDYDLTGITMKLWSDCCADDADINSEDAKKIASTLDFPHIDVDLSRKFREKVVESFIFDYHQGKTPNPCVVCNKKLKFGALFEIADGMKIPFLATGHYANVVKQSNGSYELRRAADVSKDQTYFLWSIKKERLPFILFPLGDYTKPQIRELALEHGLPNASRSDSQDICFIPDGDYISFIKKHSDISFKSGDFVDIDGNVLGKHQGLENYTIGQRKGLGISLGKPMFVGKKNTEKNTVTLCSDQELYASSLTANSLNFLVNETFEKPIKLQAKIRYRHSPASATVTRIAEDKLRVDFDLPQRAITAGQSLVLYDGDTVVGGGIIE